MGDLDYDQALRWPVLAMDAIQKAARIMAASAGAQLQAAADLEAAFARWMGVDHALSFANGTSAIFAALHALNLEPSSEILVPSLTYWASVLPACWLGLIPVFCDVDPETLCISADEIERRITARTRAVLVVHLFGQLADMDRIVELAQQHDLAVIEDASQAIGATHRQRKAGTIGQVACFSLQASKYLPAGEGGMLVTSEPEVYKRALVLGHYRRIRDLDDPELASLHRTGLGFKFRIHPFAAALALELLPGVDQIVGRIKGHTQAIAAALAALPGFRVPPVVGGAERAYWTRFHVHYAPGVPRPQLLRAFEQAGVLVFDQATPYGQGLHREPVFQSPGLMPPSWFGGQRQIRSRWRDRTGSLPVTEGLEASDWITFPVFHHADRTFIDEYLGRLRSAVEGLN